MPGESDDVALGRRVAAAAWAAWRTVGIGAISLAFTSLVYLAFRALPAGRHWLAWLWGVPPETVPLVWIISLGTMKFALLIGVLGCVFLSLWWRRLARRMGDPTAAG